MMSLFLNVSFTTPLEYNKDRAIPRVLLNYTIHTRQYTQDSDQGRDIENEVGAITLLFGPVE
jgi:hypothetical protein